MSVTSEYDLQYVHHQVDVHLSFKAPRGAEETPDAKYLKMFNTHRVDKRTHAISICKRHIN